MGVWVHDARRLTLGFALLGATVMGIAGCTSQQATPGTTLAPVSSSVVDQTAARQTARLSEQTPPTGASTTAESFATESVATPTNSPASQPAWAETLNLTAAQVVDAEAALAAYRGYSAAVDQSATDPTQDWSALIRTFAADPAAATWLEFLQRPAVQLGRGSGQTLIAPVVTKVEPALVSITDCIDTSQISFVAANGESLVAPDEAGTYRRHPATIQVGQFDGGQWLVTYIDDNYQVQC